MASWVLETLGLLGASGWRDSICKASKATVCRTGVHVQGGSPESCIYNLLRPKSSWEGSVPFWSVEEGSCVQFIQAVGRIQPGAGSRCKLCLLADCPSRVTDLSMICFPSTSIPKVSQRFPCFWSLDLPAQDRAPLRGLK